MQKSINTSELKITRDFDAPRELIWKAWTNPNIMKKWWGPKDFSCPYCEIDLRVGGTYLNCMRSPEGEDYWSTGEYIAITPMEKIVCTDSFADKNGNVVPASYYGMEGFPMEMQVTIALEKVNGKTRMTLEHKGIPEGEIIEQTREGWNQSFDKLVEALKRRTQWS